MDGCLISFLYLGFARPLRVFFELFTLAVSSLSLLKTAATRPDGTVRKHHEMPLVEAYHLVFIVRKATSQQASILHCSFPAWMTLFKLKHRTRSRLKWSHNLLLTTQINIWLDEIYKEKGWRAMRAMIIWSLIIPVSGMTIRPKHLTEKVWSLQF